MSLRRVNFLIVVVLAFSLFCTVLYTYNLTKKYFQNENVMRIKGDVLELGYSVSKSIEQEGLNSSISLLYNSLATHKEYQTLSLSVNDKIILSTDKKIIGTLYKNQQHIDKLEYKILQKNSTFYQEFSFLDKESIRNIFLIIDLNEEYLMASEKEVQQLVNSFLLYLTLIMLGFLALLYFLNIRPLVRLNKGIKNNRFSSLSFYIKEYSSLYNSFVEKYNEILLLNKTLEDKVAHRTELLTKTNTLFKEAQKLTQMGNWEWNIGDNSIVWSDEIYVIFGLKPQEFAVTYEAFINIIHVDDRAYVQDSVNRALKTGQKYEIIHRIVLADKSQKIVCEKGSVELDTQNRPIRMIGTVQDITQRFKREKELELQSKLLNAVTDSIFIHNFDGTFIYVNESAYKTRGYTKDELMQMRVQELDYCDEKIDKEIKEKNIKYIQQELAKKEQVVFETLHKTKDGNIIPIEVTSRLFLEDKKSYIISIARDISERKEMYKSIEASEKQYRKLVENSQIGIFNTNVDGDILYANETLIKVMGYESAQEMYKHKVTDMYKNMEQRNSFINQLLQNGKVNEMEIVVITKQKEEKTMLISAHIEGDYISGILMDITASKHALEEIRKLSRAIEEIDDVIMISDKNGVLTFVNDAYVKHTGFSRDESIGKTAAILKSGKHDRKFYKNMWREILLGNVFRGLFINKKKDGEVYYEEKTISPIKNEAGEITSFVSTGKDITQRIEMQQDLQKLASTDKLTGIYNRHKFEELFKAEVERVNRYESPLTLIMFDIDNFKVVNDTFGHDVGDNVLKSIVVVANENIRTSDIFARWGGEEFFILCPETDAKRAQILAEKLRNSIQNTPFDSVGTITCSFGVSTYRDKESIESLIKRVDDALYYAKNSGRNRIVFK